ncbi:hypothetical protein [Phenylobacterium sp. J367]|nr:hypothetical protein [Phenylobacterium sp. J367]MCR5877995.1 hypothetical protein [Phenylobacterium sp. J367]
MPTACPWLVESRTPFCTSWPKTGLSKPAAPLCTQARSGDFNSAIM